MNRTIDELQDDIERLTAELDVLTTEFAARKNAMTMWTRQVQEVRAELNGVFAQPPPTNDSEAAAVLARRVFLKGIIADFQDMQALWLDPKFGAKVQLSNAIGSKRHALDEVWKEADPNRAEQLKEYKRADSELAWRRANGEIR
jgi:hypothetical protein